jgi:hypothetical protein
MKSGLGRRENPSHFLSVGQFQKNNIMDSSKKPRLEIPKTSERPQTSEVRCLNKYRSQKHFARYTRLNTPYNEEEAGIESLKKSVSALKHQRITSLRSGSILNKPSSGRVVNFHSNHKRMSTKDLLSVESINKGTFKTLHEQMYGEGHKRKDSSKVTSRHLKMKRMANNIIISS